MSISVREAIPTDASAITKVVKRTYDRVPFSNRREHLMVNRLRTSPAYVPQLSLVAEVAGEIIGHILLTRITIREGERNTPSLSLAPLSVVPEFHGRGVGGALINEAHRRARQLDCRSVVVVGIEGYYPKFGYEPMRLYPIKMPLEVNETNCAIVALCADGLTGLSGLIEYALEWMES